MIVTVYKSTKIYCNDRQNKVFFFQRVKFRIFTTAKDGKPPIYFNLISARKQIHFPIPKQQFIICPYTKVQVFRPALPPAFVQGFMKPFLYEKTNQSEPERFSLKKWFYSRGKSIFVRSINFILWRN